jgi:predicted amidohydrolase
MMVPGESTADARISLLHLSLEAGALDSNLASIERGITVAAAKGADWVVTPELSISGYQFADEIGTSWIGRQPDTWMRRVCELAHLHKIGIILGHAERDDVGRLYNSAFLIGPDGSIVARHRKVNPVAEAWACSGERAVPFEWNGLSIGILICSDACPDRIAAELRAAGAQLLVSPCSWGPGLHGPAGEWEARSAETRLPLFVCNRTGRERSLIFSKAESLVIDGGNRLLEHTSEESVVLTFDWSSRRMLPQSKQFEATYLA